MKGPQKSLPETWWITNLTMSLTVLNVSLLGNNALSPYIVNIMEETGIITTVLDSFYGEFNKA